MANDKSIELAQVKVNAGTTPSLQEQLENELSNAQTAVDNANAAATAAAAYPKEHMPYIGNDGYWYVWNETLQEYEKKVDATGDEGKANKQSGATEGNIPVFDDEGDIKDSKISPSEFARKDGYYGQMSVGASENLVGDTEEESTFTTQMTGGEVEFGSGAGQLTKVQGNGIAWNQQCNIETSTLSECTITKNADGSFTVSGIPAAARYKAITPTFGAVGHKVFYKFRILSGDGISIYDEYNLAAAGNYVNTDKSMIYTEGAPSRFTLIRSSLATEDGTFTFVCFDLSLIFGLGNEPTTVEDAEARLAALIPANPYYQPNAGELFGTKVLHLVSYGQNLLNPANRQARLAPYSYESIVNKYGIAAEAGVTLGAITFTPDATGEAETITPDNNGQFVVSGAGTLSVSVSAGSLADVYVWAVYDGAKDGIDNFVPFQQDALEIKAGEIYGKLNGTGEYVKVFADGVMRGAGNVHDLIDLQSMTADVNVGNIDLGSVDWTASNGGFHTPDVGAAQNVKVLCSKYAYCGSYGSFLDKGIGYIYYVRIFIRDSQYTNDQAGANQLKSDMSGVFAWFQLATPLHYTDLKLSSDGGETFRDLPTTIAVDNWGVWQQKPSEGLTPVTGHDFEGIAATISTILPMDAVEILKSVQDNGIMTSDQRAQLTNILTALQTAGIIGSFTIAESPTNKVFPITVTAPETPTE